MAEIKKAGIEQLGMITEPAVLKKIERRAKNKKLMEKNIYSHAYPFGMGTDSRTMMIYFGISLLIHLSFIGYMVFLPESAPRRRFSPGSINVSLVSLPGPPPSAAAPASKPAAKTVGYTETRG